MDTEATRRLQGLVDGLVILAALVTIPLTIVQVQGVNGPSVMAADWLVWSIFVVDYAFAVAFATDRWKAARRNWLSLAVVILSFPALPALLALTRIVRLVRVVRLFRVLRFGVVAIRGLQALRQALAHRGLIYVIALTAFLIVTGGTLVSVLEPDVVRGGFWSGVWWAVVTTTTVGYGDISPSTLGGRLIAAALMLAGIGLVATLAASVAAYFVGKQEESDSDPTTRELAQINTRLTRIEQLLESERHERER